MEVQSHKDDTSYLIDVVSVEELTPGQFKTFEFYKDGILNHGLVINYEGVFYGYVNLCPHAHIPLDAVSRNIFNADGSYLICRKHWALFEPKTGSCVSGPCPISPLSKLDIIIQNGTIYVAT
ncbi:MAG: Rieske 2Fe-2S domain-containing protein [Chlorobiales bacterium]|jgi:nitrite reductase/ring-hydroxylating ferredoxin subunit|nr:Rieske 2Fe-2S domain-containing protein [Chlorobiales bacterium]